jgi:adenylate cyclase
LKIPENADNVLQFIVLTLLLCFQRYAGIGGPLAKKDLKPLPDDETGGFLPTFTKQPHAPSGSTATDETDLDIKTQISWPSVLVRPLDNLSGDPELDFWGSGLASELADELNHYPDIGVLTCAGEDPTREVDKGAVNFVVNGNVRCDGTSIKVIVKLTDTQTGHQIWSESHRLSIETGDLIAFQEKLASSIAVKIAGERGWVMKALDKDSKRRTPQHSSVYEAVLRYIEYDMTFS